MTSQALPIGPLLKKVSTLLEQELHEMLHEHMTNYHEYKSTYNHLMKLPLLKQSKLDTSSKDAQTDTTSNQICEMAREIASLKEKLHHYENEERCDQEHLSLKITEPILDRVVDTETKVYNILIEKDPDPTKEEEEEDEEEEDEEEEEEEEHLYIVRGMRGTLESGYQAKVIEHFTNKEEAMKYYNSLCLEMYAGKEIDFCSTKEEVENESGDIIESEYNAESDEEEEEEEEHKSLCKNQDCSPIRDTEFTEKCSICSGYFADNGVNDIYFLSENGGAGSCNLCKKTQNVCIMKGTGQYVCVNACNEEEDEEEEE